MFAGVMGRAQGLDTAIEAARLLQDDPSVRIVLMGDGLELANLRSAAAGLPNVRFIGRQPEERMSDFFALADVLLVHLRDEPVFRLTIPHKVFAYMASGRPVLAAVHDDTAAVVERSGAGVASAPGSAQGMADAIRRLRAMPPAALAAMGENGRRAACEQFSREHLTAATAEVLERVAASRRR